MLIGALYLLAISSSLVFFFNSKNFFNYFLIPNLIALIKSGGFGSFINKYSYAVSASTIFSNSTCGLPKKDYFNLVRDVDSEFPWTGL